MKSRDYDKDDFRNMDPWRLFRIMAEFVEGIEHMSEIDKGVSIFGSARIKEGTKYYELAREVAKNLSLAGFDVITGGGPGIMEAANRGANESGVGKTVGLNIDLPFEQTGNPYVQHGINFRYFFVRKVMFLKYASAVVVMPGGFGTLDEFFEILTLVQTHKVPATPIVLMGEKFWQGALDWIREVMLDNEHVMISPDDLNLLKLTDDPQEAVEYIEREYGRARLKSK